MPFTRHRSRETDLPLESFTASSTKNDPCGVWPVYADKADTSQARIQKDMYDATVPNFKARRRRGEIIRTQPVRNTTVKSYNRYICYDRYTQTSPQCCNDTLHTGYLNVGALLRVYPPVYHLISEGTLREEVPQLLKSAIAQSRDVELDLLTTLGERKETFEHISGRLQDVGRVTKNFRNSLKRHWKREEAHALWLEYRYAVMPNVLTVQSLLNVLTKESFSLNRGFGVRKFREVHDIQLDTKEFYYGTENRISPLTYELTTEAEVRSTALARAVVGGFNQLKINPITTIYELTRLSFVVDWFVDIGDTLASYGLPWEAEIVDSSYSMKLVTVGKPKSSASFSREVDFGTANCGDLQNIPFIATESSEVTWLTQGEQRIEEYIRDYINPDEAAWLPRFRLNLNFNRLIDAVALLRGLRR